MIQLIDAVPPRAFDWAGYELTQHAQHAADVHADRLTTYGSYDVHDNELTGWVHLLDEADAVRIDTLAVRPASRHQGIAGALLDAAVRHTVNQNVAVVRGGAGRAAKGVDRGARKRGEEVRIGRGGKVGVGACVGVLEVLWRCGQGEAMRI